MDRLVWNLMAVVHQSALLFTQLVPYVLAGAAVASFLVRWGRGLAPHRLLGLPNPLLIAGSAVLGTISPLCTMGTVPLVIGLVHCGLPVGGGIAFLISSSLANPQMLLIGAATIGPVLTSAQWASAIGLGCTGGLAAMYCEKRGFAVLNDRLEGHATPQTEGTHGKRALFSVFLDQLEHVLLYVVLGVVGASIINVWLPGPLVERLFGRAGYLGVAAGTFLSVPFYVCGGGVLPTMAALMAKGLAPGIVLAFVIAGPATRLQALVAVGAFMSKRAMAAYLILIWAWAFAAGALLNGTAYHPSIPMQIEATMPPLARFEAC